MSNRRTRVATLTTIAVFSAAMLYALQDDEPIEAYTQEPLPSSLKLDPVDQSVPKELSTSNEYGSRDFTVDSPTTNAEQARRREAVLELLNDSLRKELEQTSAALREQKSDNDQMLLVLGGVILLIGFLIGLFLGIRFRKQTSW